MGIRSFWRLLSDTYKEWSTDGVSHLAAGIAFYTIFSLSPVLVILVAIIGQVYGEESARAEILQRATEVVGPQGSEIVGMALRDAHASAGTATLLGIIGSLFGATVVFASLQEALNAIWAVAPKPGWNVSRHVKKRLLSFLMIMGMGFIFIASLVASAALRRLTYSANGIVPVGSFLAIVDFLVWLAVLTICFAVIYKMLPDAHIAWADVWVGAALAATLFGFGKALIASYLARSAVGSAFGAASSLAIFLIWIYYSAQIFLICGEFTQVYAKQFGSGIKPDENSVRIFKTYKSA
jgi:membrane protein